MMRLIALLAATVLLIGHTAAATTTATVTTNVITTNAGVATTTAAGTPSCQTATASLTPGSYCASYSAISYCSVGADANKVTTITTGLNFWTTSNVNSTYNPLCAAYSGSVNVANMGDYVCKPIAQQCDASCGSTATAAASTTTRVYCCSYIRDRLNVYCLNANTDNVKPGVTLPAGWGPITSCADSDCYSAASSLSASLAAVVAVAAALLALLSL